MGEPEPFPSLGRNEKSFVLQRGVGLMVKSVGLQPHNGKYSLFGSERFLPKVNNGTAEIAVVGYLDVPGCLWPASEGFVWNLVVKDKATFRPLGTIEQVCVCVFICVCVRVWVFVALPLRALCGIWW